MHQIAQAQVRPQPRSAEFAARAFLIGLRYQHHAHHSGYHGFTRYIGTPLRTPIGGRRFAGRVGRTIDGALASALGQPMYSVGVMLAEIAAAAHMLRHARGLYHVLYGERDLFLLRPACGVRGNRVIATFHGPLARPASIEWVSRSLDAAILVSDYQRRYFDSLLPPERIFVARHGVDTTFFRPSPEPSNDPLCITVGSHLRDFHTLTRTMAHVWKENPAARLLCVGVESPSDLGPLLDDARVHVLPRLSDPELRSAYQRSRLALFAFQDATASNALLEAMACGLPIVATAVGGIPEYVGEAGVLCRSGDAPRLAEGVLQVLADAEQADAMGQASRAEALRRDYRLAAAEILDVYARVLGTAMVSRDGRRAAR